MSVNFSNSTPAAPAGMRLATIQTDGSGNFSIAIPVSPTALIANNVDLTAQTADIAATNLLATPTAGMYRVSAYIIVTTVDGASSTLPSVEIEWTDKDNAVAQTITLTPTNTGNLQTTYEEASCVLSVSNTAAIQYATTGYASGTPATMQYALHIRIEEI